MNMKKKFLVAHFSAAGTTAGLAKNVVMYVLFSLIFQIYLFFLFLLN